MTANTLNPALDRRAILGRIGAVGSIASTAAVVSAAVPATAAAGQSDPHIAWLQLCFEARNRCDDDPDEHEGAERHYEEYSRLRDLILNTPAFTTEGALARTALLADQSLVIETEHRQIRPALDGALMLLRVTAWRHP